MIGVNKVILVGNVGKNPDVVTFPSDGATPVKKASFPLATTEARRNRDNERVEITEWHNVVCWRGLADVCAQYLAKGRKVAVVGPVSASAYIGNDGNAHASLEITAEDVEFLTPKQDGQQAAQASQKPANQNAPAQPQYQQQRIDQQSGFVQVDEEELPF